MKRVLLTAVALLFGAVAFAQPSASVETLARKYADRDGALVMRLDSTMVGLVKLRCPIRCGVPRRCWTR